MNSFTLPPALRLLLRLLLRAQFRKMLRGARSVKGALYLCVTVGMLLLWVLPALLMLFFSERSDPAVARAFLAPGLLLFCVLTLVTTGPDSGIFFFPAEVDLLFPAPFHRRQLLLYRLSGLGVGILITSLLFSVLIGRYARTWVFGFSGVFLALSFIQLLPVTLVLVLSIVGARAYSRARKTVLWMLAAVLTLVLARALAGRQPGGGLLPFVNQMRTSPLVVWLSTPFEVFSRTITAQSLFEFAGWGALALLIDAVLVVLIIELDSNFLESSLAASQRVYEKLERIRRGQAWANLARPGGARWRMPMPPHFRGAGPIAWRHLVAALRGSRGLIAFVLLLVGAMVIPAFLAEQDRAVLIGVLLAGFAPMLCLFILPQMLQFDFRNDLERIDALKAYPASPAAVAVGELITPVLVAMLLEAPLALAIGYLESNWRLSAAAVAMIPVMNLMVFAIENLVFLWFPYRVFFVGAADLQAIARQMLIMLLKFFALSIAAGIAAGAGGIAYWLTGGSWPAFFAAAWCVLAGAGLSLVPFVASAFKSFDPSLDTAD